MIEELRNKIREANEAYRSGVSIISDAEFDILIDELIFISPDDELLSTIGHVIIDESRKRKLEIPMASMNKIKSLDDIKDWKRTRLIPSLVEIICTPKYDGLSLAVNEVTDEATTRGDGLIGQSSDDHYKKIGNHLNLNNTNYDRQTIKHSYGEVMMSKKVFLDKYSNDFANPRNLVAGLINSPDAREALTDLSYIKYGGVTNGNLFTTKKDLLDCLNDGQDIKVPYYISNIVDLTEDKLISLFKEWSVDFEIDGIILEVNNLSIQGSLGREKSGNPVWARAFKHPSFEQTSETEVIGLSWNISKQGLLKPIIHINPVKLDGVTVSNVTGNNARFIKDMGIGIGAKVLVKRSGMVIPLIVDVLERVDFKLPIIDGVEIDWNKAGIELITLTETDDQKLKKNIAFFEILESDNVSEGVITQLWDAGHKTIKDILSLKKSDLEEIDRFGKRKSKIVFDSIQKSIKDVQLSKLQHATGIFVGLGSKKLALLEHFTEKPTIDEVINIDGFADISAKTYVDNYDKFYEFIKDLPITIIEKVEVVSLGNDLDGMSFVFTGVRRNDLEEVIISRGGKIGGTVSKTTSHLVMKEKGSGSSKEIKATSLGVTIFVVSELEDFLK